MEFFDNRNTPTTVSELRRFADWLKLNEPNIPYDGIVAELQVIAAQMFIEEMARRINGHPLFGKVDTVWLLRYFSHFDVGRAVKAINPFFEQQGSKSLGDLLAEQLSEDAYDAM